MSSVDLKLKLVDGFTIRNNLDIDFSGEGSDVMYNYIPSGEMWLDKVLEREKDFFVALHSLERELLLNGVSYADARKKVCERFVSNGAQNLGVFIEFYQNQMMHNNSCVWIVDGEKVRKFFDPKFIQGGHDLVYNYIPENTVWMESAFFKEYKFTLRHELYERECMGPPYNMKYYDAHDCALQVELIERRQYVDSHKQSEKI